MFVLFWFLYFGDEVVLSRTPNEMTNKELRRARVRFNRREEAVPFFFLLFFASRRAVPDRGVVVPRMVGSPVTRQGGRCE